MTAHNMTTNPPPLTPPLMDATQAARELRLFAEGRERVLERAEAAERKGAVNALPYHSFLVRQSLEGLAQQIEADTGRQSHAGAYKKFAAYLGTLDAKIAALRAIQTLAGTLLQEDAAEQMRPVFMAARAAVGKAIYREYLMTHFAKLSPPLFNSLMREYGRRLTKDERHLIKAFKAKFDTEGYTYPTWSFGDIEMVGHYLIFQLGKLGFVQVEARLERKGGRPQTVQYIRLDENLYRTSRALLEHVADMAPVTGPLIEPPLPWDAETNSGGGFHTPEMQRLLARAVQRQGTSPVAPRTVAATNYLQSVRWQVNTPVLAIVRAASERHDFGSVISADPGPKPDYDEAFSEEEMKAWRGRARQWHTDKKVRASKHRRVQKAFREAAELGHYSAIWFAYSADFRGRQYARAGGISPQGTDLEKGLLRFAEGKPLDSEEAVFWFKVHGANKFGLDKLPLAERVKWVDDNAEILSLGEERDEWREAESPVQFLAWMLEYAAWCRAPETFLSHLPLSQDGSCNGLQNFSALMRDAVGGAAVNLRPSDAPRDIYNDVAERVITRLLAMPAGKLRDAWLAHGVTRKVTKRTTMTLPYGCTRYACSEFIAAYLEGVEPPPPEFEKADYGEAANFLSHIIWAAIGETVVKAVEVMDWLKGWAKHAASNGKAVAWQTPAGLRVVSEYDREHSVRIKSAAFAASDFYLRRPEEGKPNLRKITDAVAPNFVHSLDAAHLASVLVRAKAEGIVVSAIHDDFGTHARDTAALHRIIREEFVAMYTDNNILQSLADSTGYDQPPPTKGDLDLSEVLTSQYFFS